MKYAIAWVTDGNFKIKEEIATGLDKAIVRYHSLAATLRNDDTYERAYIGLKDENFRTVMGYEEEINRIQPAEINVQPETPAEDDDENEPA